MSETVTESTYDADLSSYKDQKVVVVAKPKDGKGNAVEIEGTVLAGNEHALLVKPKGRPQAEMIEKDRLIEVREAPEATKALKPKRLNPVKVGDVRQHLLDRHGLPLEDVNKMSESEAVKAHDAIDHSKLGHFHAEKAADEPDATDNTSSTPESDAA